MSRSNIRIFISCSGLGMGNASRVSALAAELSDSPGQHKIKIASWGAGYAFLNNLKEAENAPFELLQLDEYDMGFKKPFTFVVRYFRNLLRLAKAIRQFRPTAIVLDSDYHFASFLGLGIPIFFLGQAQDVVERARISGYRASTLRGRINFFFREELDWWIQSLISRRILVPSFRSGASAEQRIPLIVRKEFLRPLAEAKAGSTIGVLPSGSNIEKESLLALAKKFNLAVLDDVPSKVEALDELEFIFTRGGLSSISECIARGKFVAVVPMRNHPEQYLNALEVERLGLGAKVDVDELQDFTAVLERLNNLRKNFVVGTVACNGAAVAAFHIRNEIT